MTESKISLQMMKETISSELRKSRQLSSQKALSLRSRLWSIP